MTRIGLFVSLSLFLLSSSGALAATDPVAKCIGKKAKASGKKAADLLKAFGKNISKNPDTKLAANVSKAQSKFTKAFTKEDSKGCGTMGDAAAVEAIVDDFVFHTIASVPADCGDNILGAGEECDGTDSPSCEGLCQQNCLCPDPSCGNGVIEAGEECETPCSTTDCGPGQVCGVTCQCEVALPCDCGSPEPTTVEFEVDYPVVPGDLGQCGRIKDASEAVLLELNCGTANLGGGAIGVPPEQIPHVGGPPSVYNVECCYGTKLAIGETTELETGDIGTCTAAGCRLGAPIPVVFPVKAISTCTFNVLEEDARGWVDCATGEAEIEQPQSTTNHLTGDHLKKRCAGGPNPEGLCETDTDCSPGGTCVADPDTQPCPICNTSTMRCNGGPNDGDSCTPSSPNYGLPQFPTSQDCPPPPELLFGSIFVPHYWDTDDLVYTDPDGQFCKFCQDKLGDGSFCFEGNPAPACPDSAKSNCKPASMMTAECGTPVPCETDDDCFAPYETCTQRTPGALNEPTARTIEMEGEPGGDIRGGAWHSIDWASLTCIPPSFLAFQDNTADFPCRGAYSLVGDIRLRPSPSGAFIDDAQGAVLD